jgi:hypothetical protein
MNRTAIIASAALAGLVALAGCSHAPNTQQKEQNAQTGDTSSLITNQPLPHYNFSQIRQTAIDIENIEAQGTQTTSFFFNQGVQDPIFVCPSLGLPVPNTAQLSNPQQIAPVSGNYGGGTQVIGQMDPNGIYAPSSSSGTAVICVNASGQPYVKYWEGFVDAVTAPATWDYTHHVEKVTGAPTYSVKTKGTK